MDLTEHNAWVDDYYYFLAQICLFYDAGFYVLMGLVDDVGYICSWVLFMMEVMVGFLLGL
jgi:hypothetical protein